MQFACRLARQASPVRQGFRVCEHLSVQDLDGQGICAFFETFKVALLLPAYWFLQGRGCGWRGWPLASVCERGEREKTGYEPLDLDLHRYGQVTSSKGS